MTDDEAKKAEESLARIGVRAKIRNLCGRCEEPIGCSQSVICEFAPYTGMRLHLACVKSLEAQSVGEDE